MANPRAGMSGLFEQMRLTVGAPRAYDGSYATDLTEAIVLTLSVRVHGPRIGDRVFSSGWSLGAVTATTAVFTRTFSASDLPDPDAQAMWHATLTIDGSAVRMTPTNIPIEE